MGDPSQVASLVSSINQYKDFKQMAGYNISCLMSHITPPHVGWRENVQSAVDSGAIDAIVGVLKKHGNSPGVMRSATECLRTLTTNPINAGLVAKSGALGAALDAISNQKAEPGSQSYSIELQDLSIEAAALLKQVAKYNPDAILDAEGGLEAILRAMRTSNNPAILAACAEVLDRIGRTKRGQDAILAAGGIPSILAAMAPGRETTEEMLKPMFRLLERLCRDPQTVVLIRECGGVEALVSQLEAHSENEAILRAGGRLLGVVAAGDLEAAIARLKQGNLSESIREFTIALLSNLALQPDNIDRIVQQGGVKALIDNFDMFNAKTQEAAARALGRLANNPENVAEIIKQGGLLVLVNAIKKGAENPDLVLAATQALAKITASSLEAATAVMKAGGLKAVIGAMSAHPENTANTLEALTMIEAFAAVGYDMSELSTLSIIKAIVAGMAANLTSAEVQLAGNNSLSAIVDSSDVGAGATVIAAGALAVILSAIESHRDNESVTLSAIHLFNRLVVKDSKHAVKPLVSGLPAIVSALYMQTVRPSVLATKTDALLKEAQTLLAVLVSPKKAVSILTEIQKHTDNLCKTKNEASAIQLESALMSAAVYGKLPSLAEAMMQSHMAKILVSCMQNVVNGSNLPDQMSLIGVFAYTIGSMVYGINRKYTHAFMKAKVVSVLLESIKTHATDPDQLLACLSALRHFASVTEGRKVVVDKGGIEACVGGIRANADDEAVLLAATEVLLQLAVEDDVAGQVAYKGGTRQVIKAMTDNCSSAPFERAIERGLMLLERVAMAVPANTSENNSTKITLVKQGAVEAVTKVMQAYPESEAIESVGARVLGRLLDREGVLKLCDGLVAICNKIAEKGYKSSSTTRALPEFSRSATTVGFLSLSVDNHELVLSKDVPPAVVEALTVIRKVEQGRDRELAMRAGLRCLGQISTHKRLDSRLGVVELVKSIFQDNHMSNFERVGALDCVKLLAANSKTADELVSAGLVKPILAFISENIHDESVAMSAFGALAALAEHEKGATKITKERGTELVLDWLKDNADSCGPRVAEECMTLLANLALLDPNVSKIVKHGTIDTVITVLDTHCGDATQPQPRVLHAAVSLLGRIAVDESVIQKLVNKGALHRVIQIANSSSAYLNDPDCMEAVLFLIESCALVDDVRAALVKDGAVDLIMSAMNANANNREVVTTGTRALQQLLGKSPETVQALLSDIVRLTKSLAKSPASGDAQSALETALRNISNLALVEGLLDAKSAATMSSVLCDSIGVIQDKVPAGAAKDKLLSTAVQALARVQLVGSSSSHMDAKKVVSTLVAVLKANPDNPSLRAAALFALGNALGNPEAAKALKSVGGLDPQAIRVLHAVGGIELLQEIIATSSSDEKLHAAALKALDQLRAATIANLGELKKDDKGIGTIGAVIAAHSFDRGLLRSCVEEIGATPGGLDVLLSVLGSKAALDNADVQLEIIDVLRTQCVAQGLKLNVTTKSQMRGLLAALAAEGATAKETKEIRSKVLGLMALMGPDAAELLVKEGGVDVLTKLMADNMDDADTVLKVVTILNNMATSKNKKLVDQLVGVEMVQKLSEAIKKHQDNEAIAKESIELMHKMAFIRGVDNVHMDADTLRLVVRTIDTFARNAAIGEAGASLVEGLSEIFHEDGAEMIGKRLKMATMQFSDADDIVECYDNKGRVYYYNKRTGETTWEKPAAYAAVMRSFAGLAKLTEAHKDNISAVDADVLSGAVKHLGAHANEPARLLALALALATLAVNDENREAIAKAGGLQAIIQALNGDHVDAEFLAAAISLLNQFARSDHYKEQICKYGGVKALVRLMVKFIDSVELCEKCLACLANLAFNSAMNMKQIMTCGGVDAIQKVMQKHPKQEKVLQLSMVLLSNLMYGNDDNKLIIGQKCGDEIVHVIRVFYRDLKLFKGALRALGNLSYCDANIRWIVENGATKCIVAGMAANKDDVEAQQISIDVIANFASLQEDDVRHKIKKGEMQSVYDLIMVEGGAASILDTVQNTEHAQLMVSGVDALSNLANDSYAVEKLINMGIVNVVVDAMQKYDWDEDLMDRTVRLIAILTYSKIGVKAFGKRDGVQVLLSAMETHGNQVEFLTSAAAALKNIAGDDALRDEIGKLGGIEATLPLMERNIDYKPLLLEMLALYIRLTRSEKLSEQIASKGMHIILKTVNQYERDARYLTSAFTLIGHLAFAKSNLPTIVQFNGVGLIVNSICEHPDSRELMTRSIQTLDNIAMASPEHAKIVIKEGGAEAIQEVISAYRDDKEVVQHGKSALLSMTALDKRPRRNRMFQPEKQEEVDRNVDPLHSYRNMLQAGAVMTEWSGGGPHTRHVYVSPDWKSVSWKDPRKTKNVFVLALRDIRSVKTGATDVHKKGRKKANPKAAFTVVGRASSIDLECSSPEDAARWVEALRVLLDTYKRDPRWLK